MTLQAKLLASIITISATAISGFEIHKLVSPASVREKLESENEYILDTQQGGKDEDEWKKIIGSKTSDEEFKSFLETSDSEEESSKINVLKTKCKGALDTKVGEEGYENALKNGKAYCTKQKTQ